MVFGTLPRHRTVAANKGLRVGYDVHSIQDVPFFTRTWVGSPVKAKHRCFQPSLNPDRSFVSLLLPASSSMVARGTALLLLGREVVERALWGSLRRDHGYTYYVDVGSHHSVLFPDYGYFWAQWSSGKYDAKSAKDPLNIEASMENARQALLRPKVRCSLILICSHRRRLCRIHILQAGYTYGGI